MSRLLRVKLRRDLRATWSRFALMTIAIAISLTVFGGVLLARGASARETRNAYASTEPASATVLLDQPVDADELTAIADEARQRPGIIEATARTQFDSDVVVNGIPRFLPVQVFVATPDDPMRMAKFEIDGGSWPPAPGEIYVARDSLGLLGVEEGSVMTIKTPTGESVDLRVAGTVYDPSLSPSPQEQTGRAYLSTESIAGPSGQAPLDQLKVQVADPGETTPSRDRDAIVAASNDLGRWLQDRGLAIREIQVPEPYKHPHQWQADSLLLALLVGGAVALVLSSILVANMLNTLFTQQIPQIGIMKAIGAGAGRIAGLYLAMTFLVAATATLLALGPAILIGRAGTTRFMGFLGIDPASVAAPGSTYLVIVALGVGLPPLMALLPLMRASRITVRAAIDHHGGATTSAATGILARLSRMRRLDRGLLMALRNTVRRPTRFALSVGLLASAGMVFVSGMSLGNGLEAVEDEQTADRNWDVDVVLAASAPLESVRAAVDDVPDVGRLEGFNVAKTGVGGPEQIPVTRTYPDQGHGRVTVTAIPGDAELFTPPTLLDGRWLNPGETGAIVINQVARNNTVSDVGAGDTVELSVGGRPTTWSVVGVVQERGNTSRTYVTAEGLAAALDQPPVVNTLRIATDSHDEQTRQATATAVEERLAAAGIPVKTAASVSRADAISEGHMGPIVSIVLIIAIAMGVVGGIGLATTMSSNILDRTREFGVMHAIGARPKAVRRIVVAEGVFLAVISCLVAAIPALLLTGLLGTGLGNLFFAAPLPYRISALAVGIWIVLVLLGAIFATDAAATRASRITVREALAYL